MADKQIQYHLDQALGPMKYYNITTASTYYPASKGGGGILAQVINNKALTGTIILVDQAKVATATSILSGQATSATDVTIVPAASLVAQPTYPRRLVVTPGGTTADVAACDVTISGTDVQGAPISEAFTFAANASTATNGTSRFKTIDQIVFPAQDGGSATFSVGALAGDTIATITNPAVGNVYPYFVKLQEGLAVTNNATADITITYLE